jgi:hypothetical protein
MKTPDEPSLEALLPAEVVEKIRETIARSLSQQAPPQASRREPILEGNIYRPMPSAFVQTSATVNHQYILETLLHDPATSKRIWASPLALIIIPIIAQILIMLYQEYREDIRDVNSAKFMQGIVQQVEQFLVDHMDQPHPSPDPTPDTPHSGD